MKTTAVASDTLGFDGFFSALLPIPSPFSYPSLVLLRYLKEPSLVFRFDGKLRLLLSILRFYATIPPYQTTQVLDRHICINACVYAFYISLSKSFQNIFFQLLHNVREPSSTTWNLNPRSRPRDAIALSASLTQGM
jgi:hypothetical protein